VTNIQPKSFTLGAWTITIEKDKGGIIFIRFKQKDEEVIFTNVLPTIQLSSKVGPHTHIENVDLATLRMIAHGMFAHDEDGLEWNNTWVVDEPH
jgi:hypothetical protein